MLDAQRVFQAHTAEMLGSKMRHTGELPWFFLGKCIADFDGAVIMDTDDIAGISLFNIGTILRHKNSSIGKAYFLADAVLLHFHAALKLASICAERQYGRGVP